MGRGPRGAAPLPWVGEAEAAATRGRHGSGLSDPRQRRHYDDNHNHNHNHNHNRRGDAWARLASAGPAAAASRSSTLPSAVLECRQRLPVLPAGPTHAAAASPAAGPCGDALAAACPAAAPLPGAVGPGASCRRTSATEQRQRGCLPSSCGVGLSAQGGGGPGSRRPATGRTRSRSPPGDPGGGAQDAGGPGSRRPAAGGGTAAAAAACS